MKKEIAAGMGLVMTVSGVSSAAAETFNTDSVACGNKSVILKDENLSIANRFDPIFERLGVVAMAEQQKTTSYEGIVFKIGDNNCWVFPDTFGENGISKKIDTCSVIVNNRTMVPLRAVGEFLGAKVNYDSKTEEIELNKDAKKIKFKIGSNEMEINGNKSILDVVPFVDENNRTMVPLRSIVEGLDKIVSYNNGYILIGGTELQQENYINSITTQTEISSDVIKITTEEIVSKFLAGSEFTDISNQPFSVVDNQSGIVVTFSNKDFLVIDKKISQEKRKTLSTSDLQQEYIKESSFEVNRDKLKTKNCKLAFIDDNKVYNFTDETIKQGNNSITSFDSSGQETLINYTPLSLSSSPQVSFNENLGVCIVDNNMIVADVSGKKFEELPDYQEIGTRQQRIGKNLWSLYYNQEGNPFNLDMNEINTYLNTYSDEGLKSFQIAKGEKESFIIITGGEYGLNELYVKTVKKAVKRLDEIDPNIIKELVKQNGLKVVTFDLPSNPMFGKKYGYTATYLKHDFGGAIYLNQKLRSHYLGEYDMDKLVDIIYPEVMESILVEGRALGDLNDPSFKNNLNKIELEKSVWFLEKIVEKYKDKLTQTEYILMSTDAKNNIKAYQGK